MSPAPQASSRRVVGCMTGTSIDGLDAALVEVSGAGQHMSARFVRGLSRPLGPLASPLRELANQSPMPSGRIAALARDLSLLHAAAIAELLRGEQADLVVAHGQTVFHQPPLSWQLMNPGVLAHELRGPAVITDLRAADLAAGGQGAPITPLADWILFGSDTPTAIVNLGGFCNITLMAPRAGVDWPPPATALRGLDVCVCNQLLDTIARRLLGTPFDQDGQAAASAEADVDALDDLLGVLAVQASSRRSLGTADQDIASWIGRHWRGGAGLTGPVLAATACEAIAQTIADAVHSGGLDVQRILLAGGGVKNAALRRHLESVSTARVETTDAAGVPADYREAAAMGVLGALCADGVPITLRQVTGCVSPPLAGLWTRPIRAR